MDNKGRVHGLRTLYGVIGLYMSMPTFEWDPEVFNAMGLYERIEWHDDDIYTLVTKLERSAWNSGTYTAVIDRIVRLFMPRDEDVISTLKEEEDEDKVYKLPPGAKITYQ